MSWTISRRSLLVGTLLVAVGIAAGCTTETDSELSGIDEPADESLVMIGDSITVGANDALVEMFQSMGYAQHFINAQVGRRIDVSGGLMKTIAGIEVIDFLAAGDQPPTVWIIALGTNDLGQYASDEEYSQLIVATLSRIPNSAPLIWVDTYSNARLAEAERFNLLLRTELTQRGSAVVGEWHQQCKKTNGDLLADGVHPTEFGSAVFVDTVKTALGKLTR